MLGASVGLLNGRYSYGRIFQEIDEFNDYNAEFIDTDDDGFGDTDIDNILLEDELRTTFNGFKARAGFIYRLSENLNIGGSYTLGTRVNVNENFDARIQTTFDNGEQFEDDIVSEFSYNVEFPSRTSLGASINDVGGLSISASAEYVDYSATRIDFNNADLFEDELIENEFIEETFRPVLNYRAGIAFEVNPDFTVRAGYSFMPSRFESGNDDKSTYAFGTGFSLTPDIRLEIAAQYTNWEEQSVVYDYAEYDYSDLPDNPPTFQFNSEDAMYNVDKWNILATLRFRLY